MSALMDLSLQLDGDWSFLPSSTWSLQAHINRAPSEDVQGMFETKYPITGFLSGDVRGSGTREAPVLDANLSLDDFVTKGIHFDRLTGQLHWEGDEIRLSGADLRQGTGRVTGDFVYHPQEETTEFNLAGRNILLDGIQALQSPSLPVAGQLEFDLKGSGPLRQPVAQGDIKLVDLKIGTETQGNLRARSPPMEAARTFRLAPISLAGNWMVSLRSDSRETNPFPENLRWSNSISIHL